MAELSEDEFQLLYGRWQPLKPREVGELLDGAPFRWWIGGGWAIEAAGGTPRRHDDTDVVMLLDDLPTVREWLAEFHLWEAHAGALQPLLAEDEPREGRRQLWVRRDADSPWLCDIQLNPVQEGRWLFKRDARISLPLDELGRTFDGIPYLWAPVMLLHKAKTVRAKDQADFDGVIGALSDDDRRWLDDALALAHPGHPWGRSET
ncbi:MAG TPA: hypothetical protein VGU02_14425 [Gaiellaceae bacterium]|nr:hypothetical protein [Gaiellaceae bacterium]